MSEVTANLALPLQVHGYAAATNALREGSTKINAWVIDRATSLGNFMGGFDPQDNMPEGAFAAWQGVSAEVAAVGAGGGYVRIRDLSRRYFAALLVVAQALAESAAQAAGYADLGSGEAESEVVIPAAQPIDLVTSFRSGSVLFQRSLRVNFNAVDAFAAVIDATLLESGVIVEDAESEGGGESDTEEEPQVAAAWAWTHTGLTDFMAEQIQVGDTLTIGERVFTFVNPGAFDAPDQLMTQQELDDDSETQYQQGVLSAFSAVAYLLLDLAGGISAEAISPGTEPVDGVELDMASYSALAAAVPGDPDQSEGDWPPMIILASSGDPEFHMSLNTTGTVQLAPYVESGE